MILVYSNRNRDDATFADELHQYQVKVHHVFTQEEVRGFEQGRIDKEKIVRLVPDFKERDIYICGPVPMMDGLVELFSELGVPRNQIHFERFGY
jgi:ferredoxin-NADP reductase